VPDYRAHAVPVRAGRLAAFTDDGSLTVRNWLTTRRFDRREYQSLVLDH
jgi:hypothetical protein